jgi:hypothetical protein
MRSDTLRTYKTVHTWTGIIAGLALFIAFYAGALTMFKAPIARWVSPPSVAPVTDTLEHARALMARSWPSGPTHTPTSRWRWEIDIRRRPSVGRNAGQTACRGSPRWRPTARCKCDRKNSSRIWSISSTLSIARQDCLAMKSWARASWA